MKQISLALKEWAIVCRALDRGEQVLVLRKGGIREQKKRFILENEEFLLFPSYEHQRSELLKPQYYKELDETLAGYTDPAKLTVYNYAEVEDILEITEPEIVSALEAYYIVTTDYAQYRLHWRPKHPLSVLLVRVYRLPKPVTQPILERYGGCTSWVDLEQPMEVSGAVPVLDDATFEAKVRQIKDMIKEHSAALVGFSNPLSLDGRGLG